MSPAAPRLSKPEARWSWWFVLATPFGLAFLWLTGLVGVVLTGWGDCFSPEDVCRAAWEIQSVHRNVLIAIVVGLTVIAAAAIALGRRRAPLLLLSASIATLALAFAASAQRATSLWWVPGWLFITAPGVVILTLSSAGQVLEWSYRERRRRSTSTTFHGARDTAEH